MTRRPLVRAAVPAAVFLYLAFVRTRGISETFWFLGDQILYWRIALGSWRDLPIGGGPSSVGGTTLGPAFLWTIWGIRHLVGPWVHNLPHAGGIGIALIQSAADALMLAGIWHRFRSLALALAVTLVVGTAPYDMALSATIWNPPLAVAFVKATIALVLMGGGAASLWWRAGATATALLAVQAHSSAVFVAAPVIASFTAQELLARRWRSAARTAAASAAVIAVLEIPFLLGAVLHPERSTRPGIVVSNVTYTLAHPRAIRPLASFRALSDACQFILLKPWTIGGFALVLAACAVVAGLRVRRDLPVAASTVLPLLFATAGFALWQMPFDIYWFLTVAPCAALTIALALTAWPLTDRWVAPALALAVVAAQPARLADSKTIHRLPEYGPLARGSLELRRRAPQVRRIDVEFPLPPTTDRAFIYQSLGGRIVPDSPYAASIDPAGGITLTMIREGSATH